MNLLASTQQLKKFDATLFASAALKAPSAGAGRDAGLVTEKLTSMALHRFSHPEQAKPVTQSTNSLDERLYDTLAAFKVYTSTVAMHLSNGWRLRLFRQLDNLLSSIDWVEEDTPPLIGSFVTYLRILLSVKPSRQPGLAATSDGNLIASWTTRNGDRLTLECQPADRVRWIVSRELDGTLETAAGITDIRRLPEILAPYKPEAWWLDGDAIHRP
jgi:hypothetical protein